MAITCVEVNRDIVHGELQVENSNTRHTVSHARQRIVHVTWNPPPFSQDLHLTRATPWQAKVTTCPLSSTQSRTFPSNNVPSQKTASFFIARLRSPIHSFSVSDHEILVRVKKTGQSVVCYLDDPTVHLIRFRHLRFRCVPLFSLLIAISQLGIAGSFLSTWSNRPSRGQAADGNTLHLPRKRLPNRFTAFRFSATSPLGSSPKVDPSDLHRA